MTFLRSGEIVSRLFNYYITRHRIENTGDGDNGGTLRGATQSLVKFGSPAESEWPYDTSQFDVAPPANIITEAEADEILVYSTLDPAGTTPAQRLTNCKTALAAGHPFVFGTPLFANIETPQAARGGPVTVPRGQDPIGGHAILAVGYDDKKQSFIVRNSWGAGWGIHGYFYLGYGYWTQGLARDCWVYTKENTSALLQDDPEHDQS